MPSYRVISADSHVFEPPDLWTERVEPNLRSRAPYIVREEGEDWFCCDGYKMIGLAGGSQPGRRFEDPNNVTTYDVLENVLPGAYIPEEAVKDLDTDGVDMSIVYPTLGLWLYRLPDTNLITSLFKTYNDWVAEFCKPFPDRLKGIALLNVDDMQVAVSELERVATIGLVGAMITVAPLEGRAYDSPIYEPLWAAAQDLEMPLSLHVASNKKPSWDEIVDMGKWANFRKPSYGVNVDHWVRVALADMIFSGVFERFPKLQVGSVEMELSWVPHFLDRLDYMYTQKGLERVMYVYKNDALPRDFFHRNVFLGFQEDALGIRLRDIIGVDNMQWGSDYPHQESTFPRSREILEEILVDCTEEEKAKIAGGNASRVYRFN